MNTHDKALSSAVFAAVERANNNERSIEDSADEILALIEADRKRRGGLVDRGPWKAGVNSIDARVFLGSDDFTHDVRLYIDGDFADQGEKLDYAKSIADQLNTAPHPAEPVTIPETVASDYSERGNGAYISKSDLLYILCELRDASLYRAAKIVSDALDSPQPAEPVKEASDALINAARALADWAEHEAGADPDLTPGLAAVRAILSQYGNLPKDTQ